MKQFDRALTALNRATVAALLATVFLIVFVNVVLRYIFGFSLSWVEELSRYLMIWSAWLAMGLALREGAHIAIDSLLAALPRDAARVLRIVVFLAVVVFALSLVWLGSSYALFAWGQKTAVLRLSLGMVYLAIPIGALLLLLHALLIAPRMINHTPDAEEQAQAAELSVL